jgi:hypothetical protein
MMYKLDLASVDKAQSSHQQVTHYHCTCYMLTIRHLFGNKRTVQSRYFHPDPVTMGWNRTDDNKLRPVLMIHDPIPKACCEIISCSCHTGCTTCWCSCKKASLFCTGACGCGKTDNTNCCKNTNTK